MTEQKCSILGKLSGVADSGDFASESDDETDSEDGDENESEEQREMYELRSNSVMDVISEGDVIALFSSEDNVFELFYLCKVGHY